MKLTYLKLKEIINRNQWFFKGKVVKFWYKFGDVEYNIKKCVDGSVLFSLGRNE